MPIQLAGRHVYAWNPHRKKIPAGGERHPINLKKRRGSSQSTFCSLSYEQKEMEREAVWGIP
jgi:hypothetical protein